MGGLSLWSASCTRVPALLIGSLWPPLWVGVALGGYLLQVFGGAGEALNMMQVSLSLAPGVLGASLLCLTSYRPVADYLDETVVQGLKQIHQQVCGAEGVRLTSRSLHPQPVRRPGSGPEAPCKAQLWAVSWGAVLRSPWAGSSGSRGRE